MRVSFLLLSGTALGIAAPAFAADELKFGSMPAWVMPQPVPSASAVSADAPVAVLLTDQQIHVEPGKLVNYSELVMKIQKPEGLSAGNISIPWDPATDTVTVNKLEIHRGDKVIDVLAGGQKFTTIRRESNLEAAMLDGNLTANIQPEGLQEGDIIDLATTVEHSDPVMGSHVETNFAAWPGLTIKRGHTLIEWPSTLKLNVQGKGLSIRPLRRGASTLVEIASPDIQPIIPPKGAPPRFSITRFGEASDFNSWADVAGLMSPLFRKAEAIPGSGALHDEVEKIRASSTDPKIFAEKALQLVQDRVRYVALVMGQGTYVPASAEQTWERRFGDCKAKTALLLGILHSLNIEAEPLLVQSKFGDALAERLPMLSYFDHVLVRAHIANKTYYLDGTRSGDTAIDQIQVPDFGWGLPLVENAQLVDLIPPPLDRPQSQTTVTIDASAGIYAPAGIEVVQVIRGDYAVGLNSGLASLTEAQRKEFFDNYWKRSIDDQVSGDSSFTFDKPLRELRFSMRGKLKLDWTGGFYHLPLSSIGYAPDLDRPAGPSQDAPVAVAYPVYARVETRIKLPPGFLPANVAKLVPAPVHQTLVGVEYSRVQSATPDGMIVQTVTRSLVPEVSYKDAVAQSASLKALADGDVSVRLPATYHATTVDLPELKSDVPGSASELVTRGNTLLNNGHLDEAVADFDKALEQEPRNVYAIADRAIARIWARKFDLAQRDLEAAFAIEPDNPIALRGRALKAEINGNCEAAVNDYTASLRKEANQFAVFHRALCENSIGRYDEALADTETALKEAPQSAEMRLLRMQILARQGQSDAAAREADLFVKENADLPAPAWITVAKAFAGAGVHDRAIAAMDRAIAVKPEPSLYVSKAGLRPLSDFDGRMADLDAALKLEPLDSGALAAKAELLSHHGDVDAALALYDKAIRAIPGQSPLSLGRAILLYKIGRKAEAERSISAWRRLALTSLELNNLCWDKATAGILLESAVKDCRDALKMSPEHGPYFDSLGMVLLKLGKLDEALDAYNKAVAKDTGANSLMGRAVVYARKGDRVHSEADATAARRLDPEIDAVFQQYGLKL